MSNIITYKDPFLGEIQLKEFGRIESYLHLKIYYVMESKEYKARGVRCGMWCQDQYGEMHWLKDEEMYMIKRIYEALIKNDI